jgi:hypothetical protein
VQDDVVVRPVGAAGAELLGRRLLHDDGSVLPSSMVTIDFSGWLAMNNVVADLAQSLLGFHRHVQHAET